MTFRWRPATQADIAEVLRLVRALAEYERIPDHFVATGAQYEAAFFGASPVADAMLCEADGRTVAVCIVTRIFSSFAGRVGLWIEDIFVEPDYRKRGIAKAAFSMVAQRAIDEGCPWVEWNVLDWNEPAIAAYRSMGAVARDGWTDMRVTGDALRRLAAGG